MLSVSFYLLIAGKEAIGRKEGNSREAQALTCKTCLADLSSEAGSKKRKVYFPKPILGKDAGCESFMRFALLHFSNMLCYQGAKLELVLEKRHDIILQYSANTSTPSK